MVGGMMASAAGQVAGGLAGSALMGDTSYPKGGGMEGLTSADAGKSGVPEMVQMETGPALEYFKKAAASYEQYANQGLSYYNQALAIAQTQLNTGYTQGNETLKNLSNAGAAATGQYLKMLGLDAASPTQDIASQVAALGGDYSELSKAIAQAEKIQDPTQRAATKAAIQQQFQDSLATNKNNLSQNASNQIAALSSQDLIAQARKLTDEVKDKPLWDQSWLDTRDYVNPLSKEDAIYAATLGKQQYGATQWGTSTTAAQTFARFYSQLRHEQETQIANINKTTQDTINQNTSTIGNLSNTYDLGYSENGDYFGYTKDQINQKLPFAQLQIDPLKAVPENVPLDQTPGYQFSLTQGNQAIERSAAARGMLNSANTLASMDEYSQGLAQQYYNSYIQQQMDQYNLNTTAKLNVFGANNNMYNSYMSNLLGIASQGNNATGQISSNQINQGTNQANLTMGGGQAALNTYTGIGNAYNNAYTNQGQTYTQIQLENMRAQNSAILATQAQGASMGQQGIASAPGMMQAGYNQAQGQQYAQGFSSGGQRSGWPTYTPGSGGNIGSWSV